MLNFLKTNIAIIILVTSIFAFVLITGKLLDTYWPVPIGWELGFFEAFIIFIHIILILASAIAGAVFGVKACQIMRLI